MGRSGHSLIKKVTGRYPEIVESSNTVDIGIRFELPDHVVEEINNEMYEFKVRLKAKTGYTVRTFCNNPSGKVVLENYDDFVTVNGHSNSEGVQRAQTSQYFARPVSPNLFVIQ